MANQWDIVVVGAGPAGTSSAASLAKAGFRVLIVDKYPLPKTKPCAGGLVIRGLRRLPREIVVPVQRYCRETRVFVSGQDLCFITKKSNPIIAMTMREDFDRALADFAVSSGAKLLAPCEVKGIETDDTGSVKVITNEGEFNSNYLVAADGAVSTVARKIGLSQSAYLVPAVECEIRVDWETFARFEGAARFDMGFISGGYGWVFPKKEHLSVGIGRMRKGKAGLAQSLRRYIEFLGLEKGIVLEKKASVISFYIQGRPFAKGRVLLVGDAAGLADPLTAEGISSAILSGQLAAKAIKSCDGSARALTKRYVSLLERHILKDVRLARRVGRWVYDYPALMKALFLVYGERLCEGMMEVMSGNKSYLGVLANPFTYLRPFRLGGKATRRTKIDKGRGFR
ncbi:MAG: hypothetical protein DRH12_05905 [Deltaproteobacteria bacterium]|nr:MAG: hypothetical protein DRH12_05905 [Deltaproteobacteria bacterium]